MARIKVFDPAKGEWVYADMSIGGSAEVPSGVGGGTDYEYITTVEITEDEVVYCDLDLGAEYREVLITTLTNRSDADGCSQILTTAGGINFDIFNGTNALLGSTEQLQTGYTSLASSTAPTANRQYSYVIKDSGIFVELSEIQTLISGGCQTAAEKTARLRKTLISNNARMNRIVMGTSSPTNYFKKSAKLYVYGVRV